MSKWVVFAGIIAIVLRLWLAPSRIRDGLEAEYDFVVVGAGSAGGILAARLSEDSGHTVALLEAGPTDSEFPDIDIPSSFFKLLGSPIDWQYKMEPQKRCCKAFVDKRGPISSGRVLGGSSSTNWLVATRGSRHDYDLWADMGNKEWNYEEVLPYFKKIESTDQPKTSVYRGSNGPITVREDNDFPELTSAFLESAENLGYKIKDTNGYDQIGWMQSQSTVRNNGVRESTASTYIKQAMENPNFHVLTKAYGTKVLFEGSDAIGVQYVHDGHLKQVIARKEVILSAGAIGSPQLLMLSGVGPKEHLKDMKIPLKTDLPVGKNFYSHMYADQPVVTFDQEVTLKEGRIGWMDKMQYNLLGTGVLKSTGVAGGGFVVSKFQPRDKHSAFLQFNLFAASFGSNPSSYGFFRDGLNIDPKVFETLYGGLFEMNSASILTQLLQPYSVGEVQLKSSNPFDYPHIDPNYLSDERDVRILIEGIRIAQRILSSPAMKKMGSKILERVHPYCVNHTYDSDSYWECYVRSSAIPMMHPVGTCKMGPDGDPTAVVDSELRVRNLNGLRVVDASIMPYIPSGNTNFPTMMIAEKAADMIRKEHRDR